jgi:hypothetical protein
MRRAMLSATLVPALLRMLIAGVCNLMLSRPVMATVSARAAVFGFVGAGALMVLAFPAALGLGGVATALMVRALATIGPRRRLGVGCAGGLTVSMLSAAGGGTLMIRALAIIGPRRRLGVGCAGGLTFLVAAVSSCRRAAGMVVARAIPALVVIGPYRRHRTDHEKAAHGQGGGPCCLFQNAEHNRPPFRVTDSLGWLFSPLFCISDVQ